MTSAHELTQLQYQTSYLYSHIRFHQKTLSEDPERAKRLFKKLICVNFYDLDLLATFYKLLDAKNVEGMERFADRHTLSVDDMRCILNTNAAHMKGIIGINLDYKNVDDIFDLFFVHENQEMSHAVLHYLLVTKWFRNQEEYDMFISHFKQLPLRLREEAASYSGYHC
jgi:hypothetical protein